VRELGKNNVVLRLWMLSEAPPDVRQVLSGEDPGSWVAEVPPELVDDPLVALLTVNGSAPKPASKTLLPNGGLLLSGPLQASLYASFGDTEYRGPAPLAQPTAGAHERRATRSEYDQHSFGS